MTPARLAEIRMMNRSNMELRLEHQFSWEQKAIRDLLAHVEELEADKVRLDWLIKTRATVTHNPAGHFDVYLPHLALPVASGKTSRAAIDAAIQDMEGKAP